MTRQRVFMPARNTRYAPCTAEQRETLADALGDTPETVISVHALRRGLCRAYVSGAAAIVQWNELPGEPMGFGDDAAALWDLLQSVDGWFCLEVTPTCAAALGPLMATQTSRSVRYFGDIFFTLTVPIAPIHHDSVRLLSVADLPLLDAAPHEIQGGGFGSTRALLEDGVVACAIVDGALVAIAHTSALTPRHADIGVATLEGWRERGFATAAASLVAQQVQATGRTPVWSTGEDNFASQRVAQKLGFVEVAR
ncbi:MAG: GNAT family N-acetyltransferase, partial [Ktedonobacterales bacterium]